MKRSFRFHVGADLCVCPDPSSRLQIPGRVSIHNRNNSSYRFPLPLFKGPSSMGSEKSRDHSFQEPKYILSLKKGRHTGLPLLETWNLELETWNLKSSHPTPFLNKQYQNRRLNRNVAQRNMFGARVSGTTVAAAGHNRWHPTKIRIKPCIR